MVKRPLCLMLAAYVAGICLAWQQISIYLVVLCFLIAYLIIYLLMYKARQKIADKNDRFIWLLPLLMLLGFLAMKDRTKKPDLYDAFDSKIKCELDGKIEKIKEYENGFSLYLKDNIVAADNGKQYLCNKIIVKYGFKQYNSSSSRTLASTYNNSKVFYEVLENTFQNSISSSNALVGSFKIGNRVHVKGNLKKFSLARNPGNFNEQLYYQIDDIFFYLDADQITITDSDYSLYHTFLQTLKKKLIKVFDSILADQEAGTLIAMLLGDRTYLDDEIKNLYQENGISHIIAISGLHISLIGMFFFKILRRLKCPIHFASFFTLFFIYSYGVLTDFSVSTNRAVIMLLISLMAPLLGKSYDMISSICLSALIILLQNPMQIMSAGFLLSYSAVFGIAVVYPALKGLFTDKNCTDYNEAKEDKQVNRLNEIELISAADLLGEAKALRAGIRLKVALILKTANALRESKLLKEAKDKLINSILISISTQLTTIPFVAYFFYQIPVNGVIINLIILPLTSTLIILALMAAAFGLVYLPASVFFIGGANYILKFYTFVCRIGQKLPGNILTVGKPEMKDLFIYVFFLTAFLILIHKYKKKITIFVMAACLLFLIYPRHSDGLLVTFLDVGQGDAVYMESESGTTYLIDGGSSDVSKAGIYRITPFLLSRGKNVLDFAIVTHSDKDHTSGLIEIMNSNKIKIKCLILPDITEKDEAYLALEELAYQRGIAVSYISAGDSIRDGVLLITCLHPLEGYQSANSNAYSTVLSVRYNKFSMLLTGDVEGDGETMVIKQLKNIHNQGIDNIDHPVQYHVLKVAHHGSKNSTSQEFLNLINPEISIISCGKDNRYGHPHKEALERLNLIGSETKIIYETGAITVRTDGEKMEMEGYLNN